MKLCIVKCLKSIETTSEYCWLTNVVIKIFKEAEMNSNVGEYLLKELFSVFHHAYVLLWYDTHFATANSQPNIMS